jgi:hypothetical protein
MCSFSEVGALIDKFDEVLKVSTQTPIQWVPRALSLGVKRPGREADHSSPSSADVKECVKLYLHSRNTPSWCGSQLKKHRDNFTLLVALYDCKTWIVTLREEGRLRVFENRVLREIFGPKRK